LFFLYFPVLSNILFNQVEKKSFGERERPDMAVQTRREFLKRLGLGAASGCMISLLPGCSEPVRRKAAKTKRPNILFLFTDDQRFDTIAALGNNYIITPNMDTLVRNGTAFTNAYIMGSTSGAVCKPSRAMLLSGKHLFSLTNSGKTIPAEDIMLGELFRKEGYVTFGTGKWHNGRETFARSFSKGGNIFFGGMSQHYKVPLNDFDPAGKYNKKTIFYRPDKHSSELFSDAAVGFLRNYNGQKPFFLYVSYTAPHDPRTAPKSYRDMYQATQIPLPANLMAEHPFDNGEMRIRDEKLTPWPRTPDDIRKHIADYYAMITHVDAQIGRVLQTLKQTGQADNTIIVFAGDNGLALGRHGLLGKQNLYEHSLHIPLIISGPGIPKGRKCRALCYLHDAYPTLCELAGLEIPGTVQTKSLAPIITGRSKKHRQSLFFAYKDFQRAVRDERYKLIEYCVNGNRTTQVFDLSADPWELKNLAGEPEYVKQRARLRSLLLSWKEKVGDNSEFRQGCPALAK